MRHQMDHRKLGRTTPHRKALIRNMVTSLIMAERIETTLPKAKELRRVADRMVTWGKQGDLAARRQAARFVRTPEAVSKLFDVLGPRFVDRKGGYTRIIHFGHRRGDGASMAALEYLGYEFPKKTNVEERNKKKVAEKKKAREKKKAAPKKVVAKKAKTKAPAKQKTEKVKKKGWGLFGGSSKKG